MSSSQNDVKDFLLTLNLNRDNYQVGSSKIFMRECEKLKLDYRLHQQIMAGIVTVQRWFRANLERRRFLRLRNAVLKIQVQYVKVCTNDNTLYLQSNKVAFWVAIKLQILDLFVNIYNLIFSLYYQILR